MAAVRTEKTSDALSFFTIIALYPSSVVPALKHLTLSVSFGEIAELCINALI